MMNFLQILAGLGGLEDVPGSSTHVSVLALELPHAITPTIAGLTVGSFVGVVGFIAVMLLVGRKSRRPRRRVAMAADQVVFIPPYRPSTNLSARVLAKMGYDVDVDDELDAPGADPFVSIEMTAADDSQMFETPVAVNRLPAVTVSPVVVLSGPPAASKSEPHPLGVIKSSSSAMRAAPIADLAFDDGPTEIGEPYFDEPPQPRRRGSAPKIRKIAVAGPRFPQLTN